MRYMICFEAHMITFVVKEKHRARSSPLEESNNPESNRASVTVTEGCLHGHSLPLLSSG